MKSLSVCSFNLQKNRHWDLLNGTQDSLKNLIKNHQILLLQECLKQDFLNFFHQHELPSEQWDFHFAPTRYIKNKGYMGNCILFKKNVLHPLLQQHLDLSNHKKLDQRNTIILEGHWNGGHLFIFCIHLSLLKAWRARQWKQLSSSIETLRKKNPHAAIIIGGDFNCSVKERLSFCKGMHFHHTECGRTFPSALPLRTLDTFLFFNIHQGVCGRGLADGKWHTSSDHVPVWAHFQSSHG